MPKNFKKIIIKNAEHKDFSDAVLFAQLRNYLFADSLQNCRNMSLAISYEIVSFFDCFLKL